MFSLFSGKVTAQFQHEFHSTLFVVCWKKTTTPPCVEEALHTAIEKPHGLLLVWWLIAEHHRLTSTEV